MAGSKKVVRLSKAAREFNIGITTIVEFLGGKGIEIDGKPNSKIPPEAYDILLGEFQSEKDVKEEADKIELAKAQQEAIAIDESEAKKKEEKPQEELLIKNNMPSATIPKEEPKGPKILGKIDLTKKKKEEPKEEVEVKEEEKAPVEIKEEPVEKKAPAEKKEKEVVVAEVKEEVSEKAPAPEKELKVLGKMDLSELEAKTKKKKKSKKEEAKKETEEKVVEKIEEPTAEKPVEEKEVEAATETTEVAKETEVAEAAKESPKPTEEKPEDDFIKTEVKKLSGPTILGKMTLPEKVVKKKPVASSSENDNPRKKKRKRIKKDPKPVVNPKDSTGKTTVKKGKAKKADKPKVSEEEVQAKMKETLAKLGGGTSKSKAARYRKQKREAISEMRKQEIEKSEEESKVLQVTEFVTANQLATMLDVSVNDIISSCMSLGLFVSINQRLDAETISIVAEELGYSVDFVSAEVLESIEEEEDNEEDLESRAPVVTVMGHVDHGKTSLLDFIRQTNVIAGEAGGITQHIGAYEVELEKGKKITFLDTPGHEAFTAMRARGAKLTDIAIIIIAADDSLMPQTVEAINHAQAAAVPIIIAINKIDKPNANPEKIKEELANMNILVEDWGGKFQCQEISAKHGKNVDLLMEKILLEAEMLELQANPNRKANGTVIESSLDKGKGYVTKLLVQNGSLKTGDIVLAGCCYGKVKAMYNERNTVIKDAGPSAPILLLGLNGAPQAGDSFNVMPTDQDARSIATKRLQLQREQGLRTTKHITLDEIGRRIAVGDFKELNIIVKADVDGSVEALSDSLQKLSNEMIQVNIIHKSVGQISESDILLASASDAIIIGFQVRPSIKARKMAENEQIDIRLYSIIYNAIEEIKSAMEGMLSPEIKENIICNIEVKDVFKITKVGTIAGSYVLNGRISNKSQLRLIRDGIVVYTGVVKDLKRFKEDVKEVKTGYECGISIKNFNDIKVGDIIEGFEEVEIERKL